MDFWKKGWEQTKKHAQDAAVKAKKLASEASVQAQSMAKQAGENAKSALSDTQKHLKSLSIDSVLDSIQTGAQNLTDTPPTKEELEAYGITQQLQDFLRTLTYSNFRDYPKNKLKTSLSLESGPFWLSAWQVRHVTLILDRVKEIQDLRFVLCPQRMDESVFWQIYFTLASKYLPVESQAGLEVDVSPPKGLHVLEEEEEEDLEDENDGDNVPQNLVQPQPPSLASTVSLQQESVHSQSQKEQPQQSNGGVRAGSSKQTDLEEEGDDNDLDQYIKDVLETGDKDDDLDLENDEDLEKYLEQLDDDDDNEDLQLDENEDDLIQVSKTSSDHINNTH